MCIGCEHYWLHEVCVWKCRLIRFDWHHITPHHTILLFVSLCYSYVPHLPAAGETLRATKFQNGFGGKGANQCVAAAKLGSSTALISKVISFDSFHFIFIESNEWKILVFLPVPWRRSIHIQIHKYVCLLWATPWQWQNPGNIHCPPVLMWLFSICNKCLM